MFVKKLNKVLCIVFVVVIFGVFAVFAACSSNNDDGNGSNSGSADYSVGAWNDSAYEYTNKSGAQAKRKYSVYLPESYDGTNKLPLIFYMPDATLGTAVLAKLKSAQCPKAWLNEQNSANAPAAFLVVEAGGNVGTTVADADSVLNQTKAIIEEVMAKYRIDTDRLYLTGQSMGGIMDFALNDAYPDMFAATVYVSCQMGGEVGNDQYNAVLANKKYIGQKFVYIASSLDPKAPQGQNALMNALDGEGEQYTFLNDLNYLDSSKKQDTESRVKTELDKGCNYNFFRFEKVTASGVPGDAQEHMQGFAAGYSVQAIYDWLLSQSH